jgi:hypothetical protein
MLHCSLLKAICPKWPTGVPPFLLFWGLCLVSPSSLWLSLHGVYSPTAPSLRPLIPSGSLIRCEAVQVYHHQPQSRVPLDPVYHIIYMGDYLVWALPWGLGFGWFPLHAGWAIEPHSVALVVAHVVGQYVITSFRPVTGQLQVLVGIIVDVM